MLLEFFRLLNKPCNILCKQKARATALISNSRASTPFIPLIYRIAHAEACAITILGRYNFKSVEVFELNPNMQTLVC